MIIINFEVIIMVNELLVNDFRRAYKYNDNMIRKMVGI